MLLPACFEGIPFGEVYLLHCQLLTRTSEGRLEQNIDDFRCFFSSFFLFLLELGIDGGGLQLEWGILDIIDHSVVYCLESGIGLDYMITLGDDFGNM